MSKRFMVCGNAEGITLFSDFDFSNYDQEVSETFTSAVIKSLESDFVDCAVDVGTAFAAWNCSDKVRFLGRITPDIDACLQKAEDQGYKAIAKLGEHIEKIRDKTEKDGFCVSQNMEIVK